MDEWTARFNANLKQMKNEFEEFKKLLEIKKNRTTSSSSMEANEEVASSFFLASDLVPDYPDLDLVMKFEDESGSQGVRAEKPSSDLLKPFDRCVATVTEKSPVPRTEGELKSVSLKFLVLPTQQSLIDYEINTVKDHIQSVIKESGLIEKVEHGFNSYTYASIDAELWFGGNKSGSKCLKFFWYFASSVNSIEANMELLWNLSLCSQTAEVYVFDGTIAYEVEAKCFCPIVFDPGGKLMEINNPSNP